MRQRLKCREFVRKTSAELLFEYGNSKSLETSIEVVECSRFADSQR